MKKIKPTEKICPRCNEEKASSEFNKHKGKKDGLQYHCRACQSDTRKQKYVARKKLKSKKAIGDENMSYKIILDKNDNPITEAVEPTNQALSEQEREVLEYIFKTISIKGSSPSYKQIGLDMGIKSNSLVGKLIKSLTDKEYIARPEGGRRCRHGILLTSKCDNLIDKKDPVTLASSLKDPVTLASSLKGTITDILNRSKTVTISATGEMTFWIDNREDK